MSSGMIPNDNSLYSRRSDILGQQPYEGVLGSRVHGNATVYQYGQDIPDIHDVYIWQKTASLAQIKELPGRHYWDLCDPSWWFSPYEVEPIAAAMDGIVCSSQALADDFNEWAGEYNAICIPDRLKPEHFHTTRQHVRVEPLRFIWYGVSVNRIALWAALANLERAVADLWKIELTIMDNSPNVPFKFSNRFPIYHTEWSLDKEVEIIASHDVALLPPYPGPWGRVKSNNKKLTALACGLPVYDGQSYDEFRKLNRCGYREYLTRAGLAFHHDVEYSARDWTDYIESTN